MIFPTAIHIGRRGVPVFSVGDLQHPPPQFFSRFVRYRKWSIIKRTNSMVKVRIEGKIELELTPSAWTTVFSEWVYWKHHYTEFMPANTQTVLDVGAGCGETALLYFLNGVNRVICIEPDAERARLLEKNASTNHWNISITREKFDPGFLEQLDFDFMKMDCEGCESQLLKANKLPPCVIEVHGTELLRALWARFPQLKLAQLQTGLRFKLWILGSMSQIRRN